jgi:hypothetical protein
MSVEAAGGVNIVLGLNAATYTESIKQAQRELDAFAGKTKQAGHSTVSSMQASSAAIREMNGDFTRNTRAVERFITTIPGVGKVLQAAFPLIGGAAFGAMIVSAGMKVAEFIDKANKMPKAIEQGFASLHLEALSSTDALKLANDNLQNSINKLQGKPQNNLAIALDETRIKADDLAKSLENDMTKVKDLLEKHKLSDLGAISTGQSRTSSTAGSINAFQEQLAHLGTANNHAVHQFGADSPEAKKTLQDIKEKQVAYDNWLTRRNAVLNNPNLAQGDELEAIGGFGNQDANKAVVTGAQDILHDSIDNQSEQARNARLVPQNKAAEAAHAAAIKAAEARKKAAEDFTKMLEVDAEVAKQWKAYEDNNAKIFSEDNLAKFKTSGLSADDSKDLSQSGAASLARITAMRQSIELNKQNSDAIAESSLQMAVATGQMTKLDAARVLANMHQQQYTDALKQLQDQAAYIQTDKQYNGHEEARQGALIDNQNRQSVLGVGRSIQSAQDDQNTNPAATSGLVGAKDALNEFVIASRDAATQMRDLTNNALAGFNDVLLKIMTTPHSTGLQNRQALGNYGAGLFRSVAGTGLQHAEGAALGMFGFGSSAKLGTQANPMWTRSAEGVGNAIGSAGSFLSKLFGGGSKGPGQAGLNTALGIAGNGGGIGTIASTLTGMIPFLASGGPINGPAIVGEQGPELFNPGTSGTIIPNHKLNIGGTTGHIINIDASGSTDPAQTRVQVMRGIQAAAPHIAASTISSQNQDRRRTPPSQRKS